MVRGICSEVTKSCEPVDQDLFYPASPATAGAVPPQDGYQSDDRFQWQGLVAGAVGCTAIGILGTPIAGAVCGVAVLAACTPAWRRSNTLHYQDLFTARLEAPPSPEALGAEVEKLNSLLKEAPVRGQCRDYQSLLIVPESTPDGINLIMQRASINDRAQISKTPYEDYSCRFERASFYEITGLSMIPAQGAFFIALGDDYAFQFEGLTPEATEAVTQQFRKVYVMYREMFIANRIEKSIVSLKSSVANERMEAVRALFNLGDERAHEPLLPLLKDEKEDPTIRQAIVDGLVRFSFRGQDKIDFYRLDPLLMNNDVAIKGWTISSLAVFSLGRLPDTRILEPLVKIAQDGDPQVRTDAVVVLGQLRDRRAVEPLNSLLPSSDANTRKAIAESLGQLSGNRAVEILRQLAGDPDPGVQAKAKEILDRLFPEPPFQDRLDGP